MGTHNFPVVGFEQDGRVLALRFPVRPAHAVVAPVVVAVERVQKAKKLVVEHFLKTNNRQARLCVEADALGDCGASFFPVRLACSGISVVVADVVGVKADFHWGRRGGVVIVGQDRKQKENEKRRYVEAAFRHGEREE